MWVIAGLGNPGSKYLLNRHNIGFIIIDWISNQFPMVNEKPEHKALVKKVSLQNESALLVKPQTYMNLSGESISPLMNYYKVPLENFLVIHDDVDLEFGQMKFQKNRGPGGNNGIKSIHQMLGTSDYARLKIGVGKSLNPRVSTADHVLQNFNDEELRHIEDSFSHYQDAIISFMKEGLSKASSQFNGSYINSN